MSNLLPENKAQPCVIKINDVSYDVARHYREHHGMALPATPTMTVGEIAQDYESGATTTSRRSVSHGSAPIVSRGCCVVETDPDGNYIGPVWTTAEHRSRALPLRHEQMFMVFPEGTY